jgi:nucleotide-binding universal stress UspA family protein
VAGTILIGLDHSDGASRALDRAIAEAKESGDPLVVISVVEMPFDPEGPQQFGGYEQGARMMPLVEPPELEPLFATARARAEAAGIEAECVWAAGNVSEKITSAARDHEARLVVLAAHHHSFLGRLLGTDVAAEVERELGTSVLVVD